MRHTDDNSADVRGIASLALVPTSTASCWQLNAIYCRYAGCPHGEVPRRVGCTGDCLCWRLNPATVWVPGGQQSRTLTTPVGLSDERLRRPSASAARLERGTVVISVNR